MDLLKLGEISLAPENHAQTPHRATIVQLDRAISHNSTPAPKKDRDPENSTVGGSEIRPMNYTWTLWIVSLSISNCQGILSWISVIPSYKWRYSMILHLEVISEVILRWKWYTFVILCLRFKQVFMCWTIISLIFRFGTQQPFFIKSVLQWRFHSERKTWEKTAIAICTPVFIREKRLITIMSSPGGAVKNLPFLSTQSKHGKTSQKVSLWQMSTHNIKPSDVSKFE